MATELNQFSPNFSIHFCCIRIGCFKFPPFSQDFEIKQFYQLQKVSTLLYHEQPGESVLLIAAVAFEHCLCCRRPTATQQYKGHVLCAHSWK